MKQLITEKEILEALERQTFLIEQHLNKPNIDLNHLNEALPSGVSVGTYNLSTFVPKYLSDKTFKILKVSREEYLSNLNQFIRTHVFPGDFEKSIQLIQNHLASNKKHLSVSTIQRLKLFNEQSFKGYLTTFKPQYKGENELYTTFIPLQSVGNVTNKMLRTLEETLYMRHNYHKFASLTPRELEIITLLALGYQNNEIGEQLFISKATVEQHRKNLKRKLNIKRFVDLIRFAQAFDLI